MSPVRRREGTPIASSAAACSALLRAAAAVASSASSSSSPPPSCWRRRRRWWWPSASRRHLRPRRDATLDGVREGGREVEGSGAGGAGAHAVKHRTKRLRLLRAHRRRLGVRRQLLKQLLTFVHETSERPAAVGDAVGLGLRLVVGIDVSGWGAVAAVAHRHRVRRLRAHQLLRLRLRARGELLWLLRDGAGDCVDFEPLACLGNGIVGEGEVGAHQRAEVRQVQAHFRVLVARRQSERLHHGLDELRVRCGGLDEDRRAGHAARHDLPQVEAHLLRDGGPMNAGQHELRVGRDDIVVLQHLALAKEPLLTRLQVPGNDARQEELDVEAGARGGSMRLRAKLYGDRHAIEWRDVLGDLARVMHGRVRVSSESVLCARQCLAFVRRSSPAVG